MMLSDGLNPTLLLVRPHPLDDELLSSWVIRLATANALKLKTFSRKKLGLPHDIWRRDVDQFANVKMVSHLAKLTGTPVERAFLTTLAAYEGSLYEKHTARGQQRWLLAVGKGSAWLLHGQQYCPLCLATDPIPYFRRRWRLSLSFACLEHSVLLMDNCPRCKAPISFHGGDFHSLSLPDKPPMTSCCHCGTEWRHMVSCLTQIPQKLLITQEKIYRVLNENHPLLGRQQPIFPHLFFDGLHLLLRALCSNGHTRRLRDYLCHEAGTESYTTPFRTPLIRFDELRVGERAPLLEMALGLLADWPHRFLASCRLAHLSSTYLLDYRKASPAPYWYASAIEWNLNKTLYRPCEAEKEAIRQYLRRRWLPEGANSVNRWLGTYFT
ncbi:TniQ family protein [Rhodocyclus tenuis]|uniref:TniQ family protein n=1 Tax=Rhodocyclus gracilis TaxID=2929842 RepID=A0ABX0WKR8_9RHOO|nr:TniQ family protein [Rhodocyclus gracilis]